MGRPLCEGETTECDTDFYDVLVKILFLELFRCVSVKFSVYGMKHSIEQFENVIR